VPDFPADLRPILKGVSRSFFLTLAILPPSLRGAVGMAYLLARAADTIADSRLITRAERLRYLDLLQEELDLSAPSRLEHIVGAVAGSQRATTERELLLHLPQGMTAFGELPPADRIRVRTLLLTLIHGMQTELRTFPGEDEGRLVALETRGDLDRHTYYAAGCVGEFWTEMAMAHCPAMGGWNQAAMARRGVRFGQGLQMTNILRDIPQDLRIGRCYLPRQDLERLGLSPADLLRPPAIEHLHPLLRELLAATLEQYADGWAYVSAIPPRDARMRLACVWPLLIGLRTLERIRRARNLLDPDVRVKIPRSAVYGILVRSSILVWSRGGLERYYRGHWTRLRDPSPSQR
jgi:farnesyl-diphosphate farnesyltransferase